MNMFIHRVQPGPVPQYIFFCLSACDTVLPYSLCLEILMAPGGKPSCLTTLPAVRHCQSQCEPTDSQTLAVGWRPPVLLTSVSLPGKLVD